MEYLVDPPILQGVRHLGSPPANPVIVIITAGERLVLAPESSFLGKRRSF